MGTGFILIFFINNSNNSNNMITQIITIQFEDGSKQILKLSNLFQKTDLVKKGSKSFVRDNINALIHDIAMGRPIKSHKYERV